MLDSVCVYVSLSLSRVIGGEVLDSVCVCVCVYVSLSLSRHRRRDARQSQRN